MLKNRNKMFFFEFQKAFSHLPVITVNEIAKYFPNYDPNALTRWQQKGYIEKIRNGYYHLKNNQIKSDENLFFIANCIYQPSYVSLESALSHYNFIPEGVFTTTSISTKKTQNFQTPEGNFSYKHVKKNLFFGYQLVEIGKFRYKIATPTKALLDFLYLHPHIESEEDFFELRLNEYEVKERMNEKKWNSYLSLFDSKSLNRRAYKLLKFIQR